MFLSDLVLDGLEIDWSAHLPLMLHVIFLGKVFIVKMCQKFQDFIIFVILEKKIIFNEL